jgi:UDP-glucuronate decarboxylase
MGTINALGIAKRTGAKILLTSTSEVYGDPRETPQREEYWGNVNPIGIRSCYDEGKRVAETLMMEYHRNHNMEVRIARIFNTYGPNMDPLDGRVVSNFINQCLCDKDITIYGDGSQTRSFCYVHDMVEGLIALMNTPNITGPINLGNPDERTIKNLADKVTSLIPGTKSKVVFRDLPCDDPIRRRPDITKAQELLNWTPRIGIDQGLQMTIDYFIKNLK